MEVSFLKELSLCQGLEYDFLTVVTREAASLPKSGQQCI